MVSAIILNYLNTKLTAKAVFHLKEAAAASSISVEIIVVDNSAPKTAAVLHELLPDDVRIIENDENRGFAAANNQAIKKAGGDVILIMNNDLFINEKVLQEGVKQITEHEKIGVWAPKLVEPSGNAQRSCAHFPTLAGVISEYLFKYQLGNRVSKSANNAHQPVKVDTVIGACMFIRKAVLHEAGLFDEDYFFNVEDVDLCYRIKDLGYEVLFDPRCRAVHLYRASQDYKWYEDPFMHKSRKIYFNKHFNFLHAAFARAVIDAGLTLRRIKHKILPA